ncbi:MAG: ABC transporter permease [Gemmatimonadetes bacterium]|nr:ABC transporter permease [Gemmatimonadota bacterium]
MSLWRQITHGVRVLLRREAADREIADEVRHYFEETVDALMRQGVAEEEARRIVRSELGNPGDVREAVRAYGWENAVGSLFSDLRHGARRLRRQPGFAVVCVLTVALGIGTSTAVFSAVKPMLFEPLPYPGADRIVMIWDRAPALAGSRLDVTFGTYREMADRTRAFEALAVVRAWQPLLTGREVPERLEGQLVSAEYFRVLGVGPALGRDFVTADDVPNADPVVILSDGLWRRRFGADSAIVGATVMLDDDGHTVVGVLPPDFENVLAPVAEVWKPLRYDASLPPGGREWGHHLRMVGRTGPETGIEPAAHELNAIARSPVPAFSRPPWAALDNGLLVASLGSEVTREVRPVLIAVFGAVMLVLMIAGANVTNLLLARGLQRHGEFTVRAALGAGSTRIIRQLLTEGTLLAVLGGALGMVCAAVGVQTLAALAPPGLPRASAVGLDRLAFAFASGITALIALAVGLVPALRVTRGDLQAGMRDASLRTTGNRHRARRGLVVAQVALAVVLLLSAGLLLRSLRRLLAIDPGFDAARVLTMQVHAVGHHFDDDSATHRFFGEALAAVRDVPGVEAAGMTSQLPLSGDEDVYGIAFEQSENRDPDGDGAFRYAVTPDYFETMNIPLRRGRLFDSHDIAGALPVALINESFARRVFGDRDPVGQRLHAGRTDVPWYTIVGVAGDVRQTSLATGPGVAVYIPTSQWYSTDRVLWLVVRVHGDAASLAPAIREAIWSVDRDQPIVRTATLEALVSVSEARRRFARIVFQAFALAALVLAAMGMYGVLSGSVSERVREIGVRSALGAPRARILTMVVRQGLELCVPGVVIGSLTAAVTSRALDTLLFGVSRMDPLTHVGVVAVVFGVAGLACWAPALRAARIDPAIALRDG